MHGHPAFAYVSDQQVAQGLQGEIIRVDRLYDASQGDGGASLPGVPKAILERAAEMQYEHGTHYDMPFGTAAYRESVIEKYWQLDPSLGWGPANVLGACGGRDALVKAYQAMLALGHGRQGDVIAVSRVPWISYNWGPYGIGGNVMWSPGEPSEGWAYSVDGIKASVEFAATSGRKIACLVITNPDNPTGLTISAEKMVALARAALEAGVAFVLFDWMYHYVTDEQPNDLNAFLKNFTPEERKRLLFLDGLTKSLGASNIRNCHLLADEVSSSSLWRALRTRLCPLITHLLWRWPPTRWATLKHRKRLWNQPMPAGLYSQSCWLKAGCSTSSVKATMLLSRWANSCALKVGQIASRLASTLVRISALPLCRVRFSHPSAVTGYASRMQHLPSARKARLSACWPA